MAHGYCVNNTCFRDVNFLDNVEDHATVILFEIKIQKRCAHHTLPLMFDLLTPQIQIRVLELLLYMILTLKVYIVSTLIFYHQYIQTKMCIFCIQTKMQTIFSILSIPFFSSIEMKTCFPPPPVLICNACLAIFSTIEFNIPLTSTYKKLVRG